MHADKLDYTISNIYFQLPQNIDVFQQRDDKLILELQRTKDNLDIFSIPPFYSIIKPKQLKLIEEFCEVCLATGKEPRIYLDMKSDPGRFRNQLEILLNLANQGYLNTIGIIYQNYETYAINYKILWDIREKNIWIHCSGVPRTITNNNPLATMHSLQRWGIDTFSVKLSRVFFPNNRTPEEQVQKIKRFYQTSLTYLSHKQWYQELGDSTYCNCAICQAHSMKDFIGKYSYDFNGDISPSNFVAATRIHELFTSREEFQESRKYIQDGELERYFQEKDSFDVKINGDRSLQTLMKTVPFEKLKRR